PISCSGSAGRRLKPDKLASVLAFFGRVRPKRPNRELSIRVHAVHSPADRTFHSVDFPLLAQLGAHLSGGVENQDCPASFRCATGCGDGQSDSAEEDFKDYPHRRSPSGPSASFAVLQMPSHSQRVLIGFFETLTTRAL